MCYYSQLIKNPKYTPTKKNGGVVPYMADKRVAVVAVGLESLIRETWKYGFIFIGQYVTEKTINYITKYMYKKDEKHPTFTGKVLCSSGIGSQYTTRTDAKNNKYKGEDVS